MVLVYISLNGFLDNFTSLLQETFLFINESLLGSSHDDHSILCEVNHGRYEGQERSEEPTEANSEGS